MEKKNNDDKPKIAVALEYTPGEQAPKILATGRGYIAESIIEKAGEADVPIYADSKLADTLSKLEIGEMIPPELYTVVAEILVFVDECDKIKGKVAVNKRAAGADKEQLAARYLVDNGYTVLERNFRNKTGEIDIIAKKDNYIVFVEVKYRSNNKYGYAVEAVNYRKKQIIMHVAQFYMATRYKSCDIPCRFDVIGIDGETVTHIKNAF